MAGGLLDRLCRQAQGLPRKGPLEEVLDHLHGLLNTRQGSSALDPEYGLPDLTDMVRSLPEGGVQLGRCIARALAQYEPRLTHVTVQLRDPPEPKESPAQGVFCGTITFFVRAMLRADGRFATLHVRLMPAGPIRLDAQFTP